MKYLTATVAALGLTFAAAAPLHAQNVNANNLVSVQISDPLLENILNDLQIDVTDNELITDNTLVVQAPIGVAANVCPNVDVTALAQSNKNDQQATCTAENTSQALNQIVQRTLEQG